MGGKEHRRRIVIMGAAGRDFHNFNVRYLAPYRDVLGTAARARSLDGPPGELVSRGLRRLRSLYRRIRQAVGLPV